MRFIHSVSRWYREVAEFYNRRCVLQKHTFRYCFTRSYIDMVNQNEINIKKNKKMSRGKIWLFCISLFLLSVSSVDSQNLLNSGTINNSGTLRVKNDVSGLTNPIGGVFDYFGINQTVPAVQYRDLLLTGSGTKETSGGNFTVTNNLNIASTVTLKVETGSILHLGGELLENGYLRGSIQKIVEISGATTSSNFGNIGATVIFTGATPGSTSVTRTSGIPQSSNGYESVLRYYDIVTNGNSSLPANLVLKYNENELNGNDPTKLLLWKSVDGGQTWKVQGGTVDPTARTISKLGVTPFGRWTFSDSLHPLGALRAIGLLALGSGNNQSQPINTTLQPFIVRVTDSSGIALAGENVLFDLVEIPTGATGQVLSRTTVQTDSNGFASTTLTLGNKVGIYSVAVTLMGLNNNPVIFTASAYAGSAANLALVSGNGQTQHIGTTLINPFKIRVTDSGGNFVQGVNVVFTISKTPLNSVGHVLSNVYSTTDSVGEAYTYLKLGSKIGNYNVSVSVQGLTGSMIVFEADAKAFLADANNDGNANVGDLTTVIDKILDRIELSPENFTRADVDSNNTIDVRDAVIILGGLLQGRWDSSASALQFNKTVSNLYKGEFEITPQGLRFNLTNDSPVKGIQIALRFKNNLTVTQPDQVFNRAKHMQIPVQSSDNIVRIVTYSSENETINTGNGSIFRLPLAGLKIDEFEIVYVIVSTLTNDGLQIPAQKVVAPAGKYPETFALDQNYPNPFNGETNIRFHVPDVAGNNAHILLQIFDLSGKKISTLVKGDFEGGIYTYTWNGTNDEGKQVSSGVYIYRMQTSDATFTKRMMLIK